MTYELPDRGRAVHMTALEVILEERDDARVVVGAGSRFTPGVAGSG